LTNNLEEERAPAWSPDGTKIVFMARHGGSDFELCTMDADGSNFAQLTDNEVNDATATFSPDSQKIVFHRNVGALPQLFEMNTDGTGVVQMTTTPAYGIYANWGELRVRVQNPPQGLAQAGGDGLALQLATASPSRGATSFRFAIPAGGAVRLAIYDVQGRHVATILDHTLAPGWQTAAWDGRDLQGRLVSSGAYFARLEAGGEVQLQKMLVTR
jgi:dipeptidyl aminopeptidase/acylaminoacyl peptidase